MAQPVWNTPAGLINSYPYGVSMSFQLSASPVFPAVSLTYSLLSGDLPAGLTLNSSGLISGTPTQVSENQTYIFAVRVTDNQSNIRDRTFSILISGFVSPSFDLAAGTIFSGFDSRWTEFSVNYSNPSSLSNLTVSITEGALPLGLEINTSGLIRGYAEKPTISEAYPAVSTIATNTNLDNTIICTTTAGFIEGRPIIFSGTSIGEIVLGNTYYIKSILNSVTFTISATQNGPTLQLTVGSGLMFINLPATTVGQPVIRTYNFTLTLNDTYKIYQTINYNIVIANQNLPVAQGGLGIVGSNRIPTLLNTRPLTYNIPPNNLDYGYYLLPNNSTGLTYPLTTNAFIGTFETGNVFSFKFLGYDFDGSPLTYVFSNLPTELSADTATGIITGTPILSSPGISEYTFRVATYKTSNPSTISSYFNFSYKISNQIKGEIVWDTPEDLGQINNNTISVLKVQATSDTPLNYQITSGSLPPNLELSSNGEIMGKVAYQPTASLLAQNTTTEFTFTVNAYSPNFPVVNSSRTFTLTVFQYFEQPTDILYIKAMPSISDRQKLNTLLNNTTLIPNEYVYRPNDVYFGKTSSVIYTHAYGIYASNITQYLDAITKNHYWRYITLGELKTAVAKNANNEVVYEVVYSEVIDNLLNNQNISISQEIVWPRDIDLSLGPWYTSITDIFTSYEDVLNQEYYTSLTSGTARYLYPNSLVNMENRVAQELGQNTDSNLLPLWMTSEQNDGNTLGFTRAFVLCYTKPGFSDIVKNNINNNWQYELNQIGFEIDRFIVNKSATYDYSTNIQIGSLPNPYTTNYTIQGVGNTQLQPVQINPLVIVTLAEDSTWNVTQLNNGWLDYPSATPTPNPIDSEDFYVMFEQKTILPNQTQ
jgi:hypothetical protein